MARKRFLVPVGGSLPLVWVLLTGCAWGQDYQKRPQKNSFAVRPKVGGLFLVSGNLKRHGYDAALQGELGLKGSLSHFGLEASLAGVGSNHKEKLTGGTKVTKKLRVGALKLSASYEFNPQAGLPEHESEGNVYFGGGIGFYPLTEYIEESSIDGFGYGLHFLLGGEYFFLRHVGFFGEIQYTFVDFDREHRRNVKLSGFSLLGGLAVKF